MSFRLHDPDALAVDFEQVIISVILFTVLFANQIMICSTSAAHVPLVLFVCLIPAALVALLANQILICFISAAHVSPVLSPLHLRCVG